MKISELIVKLQKELDEHGDMLVLVQENGWIGGYSINMADANESDYMYFGEEELEQFDENEIKDFNIKENEDNRVFIISSGTSLMST